MELRIERAALVKELGLLAAVTASSEQLPILCHVLIEFDGETATLTATDLDVSLHCECDVLDGKEGRLALPAKRLLDYVKLLPGEEISIRGQAQHWASITCGKARARFAGMDPAAFPELPLLDGVQHDLALTALGGLIARTAFAISSKESRFTLAGALLTLSKGKAELAATDGHRLALASGPAPSSAQERVVLPKRLLGMLAKIAALESGVSVKFSHGDTSLFFESGSRLLSGRELTGEFPDYKRVLPKELPFEMKMDEAEAAAALKRVEQFSDERSHAIRLTLKPGELVIHSSVSEIGESEEGIPAEYTGPEIEIGFNADYLLEFLRNVRGQRLRLRVKDSAAGVEFQPVDGVDAEQYRYVVMPMRI